jgi:hypothetical protein
MADLQVMANLDKQRPPPLFQSALKRTLPLLSAHILLMSACTITPADKANLTLNGLASGEIGTGLLETASFDIYAENNRIHLLAAGKTNPADKQLGLRHLFSDDGGQHWTPGKNPAKNQTGTIASRGNDVQIASHGNELLAVWQTQGELPGMGPLASAYSIDGGNSWQPGANPAANNAGDQSHADLIADDAGKFHTVWLEDPEENGYQSLRHATSSNAGQSWSPAKTRDDATCSCCWNTLARSSQGQLAILYRDMKPRDMGLLQSDDAGATWKNAGAVGQFGWQFDGCPHTGGALAYGNSANQTLHSLIWTGAENRQGLYYLNTQDGGKTWTTPRRMGDTAIHAAIAAMDDEHIAAVWDEMGPEGSSIVVVESGDGGQQWSAPQTISLPTNSASHPRIVATATGYLVMWTEKPPKHPQRLVWQRLNRQK